MHSKSPSIHQHKPKLDPCCSKWGLKDQLNFHPIVFVGKCRPPGFVLPNQSRVETWPCTMRLMLFEEKYCCLKYRVPVIYVCLTFIYVSHKCEQCEQMSHICSFKRREALIICTPVQDKSNCTFEKEKPLPCVSFIQGNINAHKRKGERSPVGRKSRALSTRHSVQSLPPIRKHFWGLERWLQR